MMKNIWIAAAITGADQLIKYLIRLCPAGYSFSVLPGILRITPCKNSGAAFSLFSGHTLFLIICSLMLMTGVVVFVWKAMNLTCPARTACACLIGGGLSNMLDRICLGGVTDYFELLLFSFPVFNLADIAITFSVAGLLIMTLTGTLERPTGEEHG